MESRGLPSDPARSGTARPPLVVLAGGEAPAARRAGTDESRHPLAGYNPLTGYKGAALRIEGRPLVCSVLERLAASQCFSELYLAGPARIFAPLADGARLIDCDGRLDFNLHAAFRAVRERHPHGPIGFFTCDVLPEPDTLRGAMEQYAAAAPCDAFFPLVEAPEDPEELGTSAWKPRYRMRPDAHSEPCTILPGHLVIVDPDALRLGLVFRLLALSYRTRNWPVQERGLTILRGVLGHALREDFRHLRALRLPELTAALLADGVAVAMGLKSGTMTRERLTRAARRVVVNYSHRRRYPERRIHMPILGRDALSLARDIDTEEEAREAGIDFEARPPAFGAPVEGEGATTDNPSRRCA